MVETLKQKAKRRRLEEKRAARRQRKKKSSKGHKNHKVKQMIRAIIK